MRFVSAAAVVLGLFPLLPTAAGELPTATVSAVAIRSADLDRRLRVVASPAFEGRETATEGARKAADYIAAEMARAGLDGGGLDGTFFQPYALGRPVLDAPNHLVATLPDGERVARLHTDFNPFSMSGSKVATGGLVFAGYGISAKERAWTSAAGESVRGWDDYAGIDVRGRVVLVFRKDPGWNAAGHASFRAKVENAARPTILMLPTKILHN